MRKAFIGALTELAAKDGRIMLLTGDLGFMLMDPFAARFPERFINVGVAEQNMVGLATGLADAGMLPFVYSITPFAVLRPYEFIRNGPIYHRLPVRIIGAGGGFDYAHEGISHYAIEDLGVLRLQPGMTTIAPADYRQARSALLQTWDLPGPIYYRLGKDDQTTVPGLEGRFGLDRVEVIQEGVDLLIIATGGLASEAARAVSMLNDAGIEAGFAVLASLRPAPIEDLKAILPHYKLVLSVEAHYVDGGLGSLIAETIADAGLGSRLVRMGVRSTPDGVLGSQEYLLDLHQLSAAKLAEAAKASMTALTSPGKGG